MYQLVPMQFDRSVRYSQLIGNLLVRFSTHEQGKDLLFAGGQLGKKRLKNGNLVSTCKCLFVAGEGAPNYFQQLFFGRRFRQEIFRAGLDRADSRRDITVRAEEDDGS